MCLCVWTESHKHVNMFLCNKYVQKSFYRFYKHGVNVVITKSQLITKVILYFTIAKCFNVFSWRYSYENLFVLHSGVGCEHPFRFHKPSVHCEFKLLLYKYLSRIEKSERRFLWSIETCGICYRVIFH